MCAFGKAIAKLRTVSTVRNVLAAFFDIEDCFFAHLNTHMFNKLKQVFVVSGTPPFTCLTTNLTITVFAQVIHTSKGASFVVRRPNGIASYPIFYYFVFNVV